MRKITLLLMIGSLLVCADSVSANKQRRRPSPVQEEFGDRIAKDKLSRKLEAADRKSKRQPTRDTPPTVDNLNNYLDQSVAASDSQSFTLPQVDLPQLLGGRTARKEQKSSPATRRRTPDPVMQEFGPAIRAEAKRAGRRVNVQRAAPGAPPLPGDLTPTAVVSSTSTKPVRIARAFDLYPFITNKLPDAYKNKKTDRYRATDPKKVREHGRKNERIVDDYRFPIRPGAVVYDALGQKLGRLAPTVRLNVDNVKQRVPQQIRLNKDEGRRLRLRGGKERVEMAVGVQLMNGRHVSGLVKRNDIPRADRPQQAPPRRLRTPRGDTIPFAITGGDSRLPAPTLFGIDPNTGQRVPLKFPDPQKNPPRGVRGPHQEANDYLPRPVGRSPATDRFYVNLLRSLPGRGGIARSVVKIDKGDKTPPIFDVFASRSAQTRKLYLPGHSDPKASLIFLEGRLRGAKANLGPVFIAAPNLSPFPVSSRRH